MAFKAGDRVVVESGVHAGSGAEVVYPLKSGKYFVIIDGFSTTQGQRVYREQSLRAEVVEPPPDPDPDPEPTATWYVAPDGHDDYTGNSPTAPLATFGAAYARAGAGDIVSVEQGNYGSVVLRMDTTKDGFDKPVIFKAAGSVQLSNLSFGQNYDDPGAWHVEIQGVTVNGWVNLRRTKNITLRDVKLQGVHMAGGENTNFIGGEWALPQPGDGGHPEFTRYRNAESVVGLLIEGVHIHHITRLAGREDIHLNALHVWGEGHRDITVRNCTFDHNDVFSSLISSDGQGGIKNVLFEGNTFAPSTNTAGQGSAFYTVMITGGVEGVQFKNNHFEQQPTINQSTPAAACGNTGQVPEPWKQACA